MYRKLLIVLGIATFAAAMAISGCKSKSVEELLNDGVRQRESGNPGGAIVLFRSALDKDGNRSDVRFQLAKAYMATGKYEQAEKELQKVIRQNSGDDEVKLELARVHCFLNKPESATTGANEYLAEHPGSAEALEILGIASFISNKPADAERYFLDAIRAAPSRMSSKLELAAVFSEENRRGEARKLLEEVTISDPKNYKAYYMLASISAADGDKTGAISIYNKISKLNPLDSTARYKSALIHINNGDLNSAARIASDLVAEFPKRADGYRLKGIISHSQGKFTDAVANLQQAIKIQPTMEGYYFLGLSMYNLGELENALSQFRMIIDRMPSFIPARIMTSMILLSQKRLDDSISESNSILRIDAKNALAHNLLGSAYMAKGMSDEGLREFDKAIELDPKLVDAHMKKGLYSLKMGNFNVAEPELLTAVTIKPDLLNNRLLLFSQYMRHGEKDKAIAILKSGLHGAKDDAVLYNCLAAVMFSLNRPSEAIRHLQQAKISDPAFTAAYLNMGIYYASTGKNELALDEYRQVLQKDPKNIKAMLGSAAISELMGNDRDALDWYNKAKSGKDANAFIALAKFHLRKKDADKALKVADEGVKAVPGNGDILELKGRICMSIKKYREAVDAFSDLESISQARGVPLKISAYMAMRDVPRATGEARRVITLQPSSAFGYTLLAYVYEMQNNLDGAIAEMKKGLGVEKENVKVMLLLGNLYIKKKDYSQASAIFADAQKKEPESPQVLFSQGSLLEMTGNKQEAIAKYRQILAKSDNFVPALNNLSYLYATGYGDSKEALRLAISAYRLEPGDGGVMDTLGYALLKNGRSKEARKVLEKALAVIGDNPTVNYHLALACKASGDRASAITVLNKALKIGNFPEMEEAKKLLLQLQKAA